MNTEIFSSLTPLRRAVRRLARDYGLPAEDRGRLVLSLTELAAPEFRAGRSVTLTCTAQTAQDGEPAQLAVTLHAPQATQPFLPGNLPLPAPVSCPDSVTWHLPLSRPHRAGTAGPWPLSGPPLPSPSPAYREVRDADEELRAALTLADTLSAEHRRLKHELAETNAGVVALVVQLEEQDEQLRRAHGQVLRELEDALRPPPPALDGVELAVHYAPADPAAPTGGDLYDWFPLPDGTLHITVVDALGHGVRSTRSALNVTHAVRTLALEGHSLQSVLKRTHEILVPLDPELMATVLLARLDPATGELQLANGSHPPALLIRADGTSQYLEARGRGIGYPCPGSEQPLRTRLDPGDLLLLYTDGLTESRKDPIEGEARLVEAARAHAHLPLADLPAAVACDMHAIVLHADDTLALVVRRGAPAVQGSGASTPEAALDPPRGASSADRHV
ncbi:PP2C family protein-serine/threonine phosphatase [Streptomyces subrutilus]|uniref:PP2C family protein-serine/threonine phosphatase n=1 Tax=Streptomyces subrutilus TaxID=36818 RepID=UPI0033E19B8E